MAKVATRSKISWMRQFCLFSNTVYYEEMQLSQQLSWHIKLTRLMLKSFCCYFAQSLLVNVNKWSVLHQRDQRWTLLRKCLLINYSDYVIKCFSKIGQLVFLMMIKVSLNEWCQTLLLDLQKLLSRLLINLGNS